jgi:hypothetical protein
MSLPLAKHRSECFNYLVILGIVILVLGFAVAPLHGAQQSLPWAPVQVIPGYHPETEPPVLIADQNRRVHAFSSQWIGEENNSQSVRAIVYNQWSLDNGWTEPNIIILSPVKEARLLDIHLDQVGIMHVLFFGGDGTTADIYYSRAPAVNAGRAAAWSEPIMIGQGAEDPEDGAIVGDDQGNLLILYSGNREGHGWYPIDSSDGGDTWSEPELFFPTSSNTLWPFYLRYHIDGAGLLHAVWSVNDVENHGQAIYYAQYDFDDNAWTAPTPVAETQDPDGLGTQAPTITKHNGNLFMMYYESTSGKQLFIQSKDDGQNWSNPAAPFPHVGLNGPASFVEDTNGVLHLFWGQRITGGGTDGSDLHGMWHSVWQGDHWSSYDALVSGQKIKDQVGYTSFDPNTARPVISQGNVILVAWRTDRGSKGNGVWYSYRILDAPELPVSPLPLPSSVEDVPAEPPPDQASPEVEIGTSSTVIPVDDIGDDQVDPADNTALGTLFISLVLVILISGIIVVFQIIRFGSL